MLLIRYCYGVLQDHENPLDSNLPTDTLDKFHYRNLMSYDFGHKILCFSYIMINILMDDSSAQNRHIASGQIPN